MNALNQDFIYSPDHRGYTDYPFLDQNNAIRGTTGGKQMTRKPAGHSRRAVLQSMLAAPLVLKASAAFGNTYPTRPIRLIMTLPAGTSADTMARFIADRLQADLGQPVVVDNRPGASSNIGHQAASNAPADGYTLLYGLLSLIINPYLFKTVPYKPSDFTPVIRLLDAPFVLVVRANSPYRTVQDLLAAAKANPDKLTYPSYGPALPTMWLCFRYFK